MTDDLSTKRAQRQTLGAVKREIERRMTADLARIEALGEPNDDDTGYCPVCKRRAATICVDRYFWEICLGCRLRASGPYYGPYGADETHVDDDDFVGRALLRLCEPATFVFTPPLSLVRENED